MATRGNFQVQGRQQAHGGGTWDHLTKSAYDDREYQAGLDPLESQINDRHYQEYLARTKQTGLLNKSFADPTREAYYNSLYSSALQSGLGQAQNNAQQQNRAAQFNAADRGVLGGSSDVAKRADVGRALDYASLGAQNSAFNFADQYRRGDEDKKVNLMRLIESGDPASQAAISQQLHGITDVTDQGLRNQQLQSQFFDMNSANQSANSQLLGNALGFAGTNYAIDQRARGQGGQGLGWVPQFGYTNNSGTGSK